MPPHRRIAEIMVKRVDAMYFGFGDVQGLGDHRNGRTGDMPKGSLKRVQDGKQRPFQLHMIGD